MSRIAKAAAVALGTSAVVVTGAGLAMADAGAQGAAVGSPGVLSGNVVQIPVDTQLNLCGNSTGVSGLLNPTFGHTCVNGGGGLDKGDHDRGGHDKGYEDKDGSGYGD
ncbi:chaplin [Streptomyces sp. ME18-1-4]|uniref:chaplin n=1 Tax=Streptomyces sp. ME18-1-4 TaxID=3028685 RepID=UPI0029AD824E|nr:chaplin [Streptomyces sp. ME18-1-4]MDX3248767.1 chaplin [Streptomyces sp. ME18-1-4]